MKFTYTTAFGNVILYDFAGQREYYTSHAAFLQSFMPHTTGIFVVVVNISDHNEKIREHLQYWLTFVQECWTHSETRPCVILVGSYSDQVREEIGKKSSVLKEIAYSSQQNFWECIGVICLNCTEYISAGLDQLRFYLETGCTDLRVQTMESSVIDYRCYIVLDHLQTTSGTVSLQVKDICASLQDNPLLPSSPKDLLRLLQILHDKAQIVLLTNEQEPENSWVITRIEVMFKEVVGTVFAPHDFPQYNTLSPGNTGVVAKSKVIEVFPNLDVDMVIGFLEHFEFCHQVEQDWTTELQSSTACYLFPNLVTKDRPENLFCGSSEISHCSGWGIYSSECQFFTPRFLHVLLLRFAFDFAKPQDSAALVGSRFESLTERQGCTMWKSGIMWCDTNGVTTVFEVKDLKKVILIMTCMKESETHCVKLRTQLIQAILKAKEEFCPNVCIEECIMDVTSDKLLQSVELFPTYSIRHLSKRISTRCADDHPDIMLVNSDGTPGKRISDLLYFEPYALLTPDLIKELFKKDNANQILSNSCITDLASRIYPSSDTLVKVLNPDRTILSEQCKKVAENLDENSKQVLRCKSILKAWKEHHGSTASYGKLRQELDKYSIFCGRSPINLVSVYSYTKLVRLVQYLYIQF